MTVKMFETGVVKEFNDSYAQRLIEQGRAVVAERKRASAKAKKPEVTNNVTEEQNP